MEYSIATKVCIYQISKTQMQLARAQMDVVPDSQVEKLVAKLCIHVELLILYILIVMATMCSKK